MVNKLKVLKLISQHKGSKIHGRLRLHKTIHILKHFRFDFDESFTYLYYGPYSYILFDEINQLRDWSFLDETKGQSNEYIYVLTEAGRMYLRENNVLLLGCRLPSDDVINLLEKQESGILELLSTYYYFLDQGYSHDQSWQEALALKSDLKHLEQEAQKLNDSLMERVPISASDRKVAN